jgi:hypothetical protein
MSDLERERMAKSRFSSKTDAKSKWAANLFTDWLNNRNEQYGDREDIRQIKGDPLSMDSDTLDYVLGSFIMEVRKGNGVNIEGTHCMA